MLIGQSDYAERLLRALALKGDLPQGVHSDAVLTYQQDDLSSLEYSWLRRSARYFTGATATAVAAEFSIFAFGSTNGSRQTMAIIDAVSISNPGAAVMGVEIGGATFTGGSGAALTRLGKNLDDRQFRQVQSVYACGVNSDPASLLDPAPRFEIPVGSTLFLPVGAVPIILTSADNGVFTSLFLVQGTVLNAPFRVGVWWRERQTLDSELS